MSKTVYTRLKNSKSAKPKLGLALGSGGWRGLAHIGVIKALLKHKIEFEIIAGSSTGSLMGGAYASLQDISKLEDFFKQLKFRGMVRIFRDFHPAQGIFKGDFFQKVIVEVLGDKKIEDLSIKFGATAVDFQSGELIFLTSGSLVKAIRASASVPLVFEPAKVDGRKLIDGAMRMPVPIDLAKELGADKVIAINLYKNVFPVSPGRYGGVQTALKSSHLLLRELARRDCEKADLVLYPDIPEGGYSIFRKFLGHAEEIIGYGEQVVEENLKAIKKLF
ncbi:MAG: hypothetical protein COU63_01860 [Candidatus Pacebacteria bacterium CG10_big_fil_rev_8_21_14_0_10_36_11]|nr:patatin-like phospholipase family protein [Candidatus Pacearchaeota archaeon]OIP73674.1 MAG: hypothetical protein AUK08_03865 [Candidatus Pacebacteria bacterium CG2_30_36_39]PIR64744.1 MAG: hypothetical protein COU63_01860 [Candidatus Pacebacteria bacterium CG10_big_fil_rev_8_21_14_0_10_36_11]PJC43193.1 MAG: hypothetical protein CO040_00485 [Candidatus Pacebacteria bacterium CG_4_9_14_0_2_um_filter_36_8]